MKIFWLLLLIPAVLSGQGRVKMNMDTMNLTVFGPVHKGDTLITVANTRPQIEQLGNFSRALLAEQTNIHAAEHKRWLVVVDSLVQIIKKERDTKSCRVAEVVYLPASYKWYP
jgi:hypothetical protein